MAAAQAAPEPPPQPVTGRVDSRAAVTEMVVTAEKREFAPAIRAVRRRRLRQSAQDVAAAEHSDDKLGTGHGEREQSVMTIKPLRGGRLPIRNSRRRSPTTPRDNLVAMGVIPAWRYGERQPRPFPKSPDGGGFVPDPPDDH